MADKHFDAAAFSGNGPPIGVGTDLVRVYLSESCLVLPCDDDVDEIDKFLLE